MYGTSMYWTSLYIDEHQCTEPQKTMQKLRNNEIYRTKQNLQNLPTMQKLPTMQNFTESGIQPQCPMYVKCRNINVGTLLYRNECQCTEHQCRNFTVQKWMPMYGTSMSEPNCTEMNANVQNINVRNLTVQKWMPMYKTSMYRTSLYRIECQCTKHQCTEPDCT